MCVCVCVCVYVDNYSRATGYKRTIERYQRPQRYKGLKNNVAKTTALRRYGLKISEKASMLISKGLPRLLFARFTHHGGIRGFTMDRQRIQRCFKRQLIERAVLAQLCRDQYILRYFPYTRKKSMKNRGLTS